MTSKLVLPSIPRSAMFIGEVMTIEWQNFFRDLYIRVGGSEAASSEDMLNMIASGIFNVPDDYSSRIKELETELKLLVRMPHNHEISELKTGVAAPARKDYTSIFKRMEIEAMAVPSPPSIIHGLPSTIDNEITVFDGTTGKKVRSGSGVTNPSAGRLDLSEIRARDSNGLKLYEDGGSGIFVKDGGYVGVGTLYPGAKFHLVNGDFYITGTDGAPTQFRTYTHSNTAWNSADFLFYKSRGTSSSKLTVANGDRLFSFNTWAWDGNSYEASAKFAAYVDGTVSDEVVPTRWVWSTMDSSGVLNTVMVLKNTGNAGFGITSPTAVVHLAAGTATNPQIKLEDSTKLTTPETGSLEFADGRFYITNVAHQRAIDRTSDVAVSTVTCENTTTETTLWTGVMNANSLVAENMFKFHADGVIQNGGATAADEVTLRIKVGGATVATLNPTTRAIAVGSHWHIDANATQRTIGATGSRAVHIDLDIDGTIETVIAVATIDTTADMDVTVTAQWASADVNNIISLYQGFMRYKN